jgi:hypothetical protein
LSDSDPEPKFRRLYSIAEARGSSLFGAHARIVDYG